MKSFKEYEEKHKRYIKDSAITLETQLIVALKLESGQSSLSQVAISSMSAFERLVKKEDITVYKGKKIALMTHARIQQLVYKRLVNNCIEAVVRMSQCPFSEFKTQIDYINEQFNILRTVLEKIKEG